MRRGRGQAVLVAFALAAAVDLGSLATGFTPGHFVAKPLLMPLLAVYVHTRGGPRLLTAALLFGWGGDVLLLSDAEPAFLAGMASFAAGHVCYLVLFGKRAPRASEGAASLPSHSAASRASEEVAASRASEETASHAFKKRTVRARAASLPLPAAYALALVAAVASLWPGLPAELRLPVAGYSALLTAMACSAARLGLVAGAGGALFMLSDMLIATGVAEWPQPPRPDLWIMLTYLAAQSLLVGGTLRARDPRPTPITSFGGTRPTPSR